MGTTNGRAEPACCFCAEVLVADDRVASIRLLSHAHDQLYLGAHVHCLTKVMHEEFAGRVDLADVPAGVDHFLTLSA